MDIGMILSMLLGKFPFLAGVFFCLGLLIVIARVLIKFSPTKKDDAWLAAIMLIPLVGPIVSALVAFSPVKESE